MPVGAARRHRRWPPTPAARSSGSGRPATTPGFEKQGEPGSFCWTEVYTRDTDAVDAFYETVFGFQGRRIWRRTTAGVDFRMWSPAGTEPGEDTAIGGRSVITDAFPAEMPGHFLVYFASTTATRRPRTVTRLGGRVPAPPFDTPYGRIAVLADNQGAAFAVLAEPQPAAADGRERTGRSRRPGMPDPADGQPRPDGLPAPESRR